ncbi:MAG: beta-carotene 15,15'-monooxygenase [Anaerolineales bacterium]|nr:beta-carotene 15,15'-monooxygenase [Anaerolineales bacterium]
MPSRFHLGITSQEQEIQVEELPMIGLLPEWLIGTLIINGPGKFEIGEERYSHWFDGLAMLRRFSFRGGKVAYVNRFLRSRGFMDSMRSGQIRYEQFGTNTRPSFFQRLRSIFSNMQVPNNTNTNLAKVGDDRFFAITESPTAIEFEPDSLATIGEFAYVDKLSGMITTAHPHYDTVNNISYNYLLHFSLSSTYHVYCVQPGTYRRTRILSLPVREPSYMHSFGMTENYIILTEFPLVVNPLNFLWKGKPFIENYRWKPERGTRFRVIGKSDGEVVADCESESFFAFHHINAFEKNDSVLVDICAYPDHSIIGELYIDRMREEDREHIPQLEFRRYHLPLNGSTADFEVILDEPFELPRINYFQHNAKEYRFAYGVGLNASQPLDFVNQLVKVDIKKGDVKTWYVEGCYPGEPIFVPAPGERKEDGGVILSLVLDVNKENSFLLILDAASFSQVARVEVPHHIPFGFHGQFFWNF